MVDKDLVAHVVIAKHHLKATKDSATVGDYIVDSLMTVITKKRKQLKAKKYYNKKRK